MTGKQLALIRREIKEATRKVFTELRSAHPAEHFYVFALYSDDDGMTVMPSANTEEHRASEPEYRWGFSEWKYLAEGGEYFNDVPLDQDDEDENFPGKLFATMVLSLRDLDAESFFGTGQERKQMTLLCSVTDSLSTVWMEIESARLLNPPEVYKVYFEEQMKSKEFAKEYNAHRKKPDAVYRTFKTFLKHVGVSLD